MNSITVWHTTMKENKRNLEVGEKPDFEEEYIVIRSTFN